MATLAEMREDYSQHQMDFNHLDPDPVKQFQAWFEAARIAKVPEPNAMTLATVSPKGQPYTRIVLLKEIKDGAWIFFTNYKSRKGQHIEQNPQVALNFLWLSIERQVSIVGKATKITEVESDAYFLSRPVSSQIGAWTSPQSEVIPDRTFLEKREEAFKQKFLSEKLKRPPHWGGYAIIPTEIEFWQGRTSRLHDRAIYRKTKGESWQIERLAP